MGGGLLWYCNGIIVLMKNYRTTITSILKQYGVKKASIFGSHARGDNVKQSDVDLLIDLPEGMSLLKLADMKMDIEEHIQKEVDIATYRSIHPLLKEQVLQEQVILYETQ